MSRAARWPIAAARLGLALLAAIVPWAGPAGAATEPTHPAPPGAAAPSPGPAPATVGDEDERLRLLRRDIQTLRSGIQKLAGTEQGVLGELKSIEAASLQKQQDLAQAEERLRATQQQAAVLTARSSELDARLRDMRAQVARRLAVLYRLGRPRYARVLLASSHPSDILGAYRTAEALSSRDARIIGTYRAESLSAREQAQRLARLTPVLAAEEEAKKRASDEAARVLESKRALLRSVQSDRKTHQSALTEMEAAERSMGRVLSGLPVPAPPALSFDTLRGLLDWPSQGAIGAKFGTSMDRRFGTKVVHNGIDLEAPFGAPVRSVHDGKVVFAQWFRGYGLTVIVDHGGGWLSVYAHASVLLVAKGESVARGQKIALVGDTASIRGPFLYFELRREGHPVDPLAWLRPR